MVWLRRLLLTIPFVIAAVLNTLMFVADRFHLNGQRIAGYGFLFGTPWAWLVDRFFWHPSLIYHRQLALVVGTIAILWVPAALYSACLWLLLRGFRYAADSRSRSQNAAQ